MIKLTGSDTPRSSVAVLPETLAIRSALLDRAAATTAALEHLGFESIMLDPEGIAAAAAARLNDNDAP